MNTGNISVNGGRSLVLAVVLAAVLTGCAPAQDKSVCRQGCRLDITLPEDDRLPPSASPEELTIAGAINLDVHLHGAPEGGAAVLVFNRDTPFASSKTNRPLPVILLKPGLNTIKVRPHSARACRPIQPCKYNIEDVGNPDRPALDPWIIIER